MENERAVRIAKDVETLLEAEGAVGYMYTAMFPDKDNPEQYNVVQGVTTQGVYMTAAMNNRLTHAIRDSMEPNEAIEYMITSMAYLQQKPGSSTNITKDVHEDE